MFLLSALSFSFLFISSEAGLDYTKCISPESGVFFCPDYCGEGLNFGYGTQLEQIEGIPTLIYNCQVQGCNNDEFFNCEEQINDDSIVSVCSICGGTGATCYSAPDVTIPGCTCHESCASCGYYGNPVKDADCINCADGSPVKPQFLDGTGLCGKEISDDYACLNEEYELNLCLEENDASCSQCLFAQMWNLAVNSTCPEFYEQSCLFGECCPECGALAEQYTACSAEIDLDLSFEDDFYNECVAEACSGTVPTNTTTDTTCFSEPGIEIPGCSCDEACATCGYNDNPVLDADCITCADGSAVNPQYADGTGLCNKEISDDIPCLNDEFQLGSCIIDNQANCSQCLFAQMWNTQVPATCTEFFDQSCLFGECCPPCGALAEQYTACSAQLDFDTTFDDDYYNNCVAEVCVSGSAPPSTVPPIDIIPTVGPTSIPSTPLPTPTTGTPSPTAPIPAPTVSTPSPTTPISAPIVDTTTPVPSTPTLETPSPTTPIPATPTPETPSLTTSSPETVSPTDTPRTNTLAPTVSGADFYGGGNFSFVSFGLVIFFTTVLFV